ncbi:DinB family protein [Chitinimonas taiwanensis]|uniref:DinB family protein n=1 Tax=Chitinimonas taiwanensis TaxID=240412 RepID=UPI0035B48119
MSHTTLTSLFAYKAWANTELFALLATLDEAQAAELHSCLRTLNHIHVVDRLFQAHLGGPACPYSATNTPDTPTLAALREAVAACDAWYQDHIVSLSNADLAESIAFTFTDGDRGRMSREEILLHVITHGGYHRGNVGQILKSLGMAPPRDLYTKFLHQSEPARRQG